MDVEKNSNFIAVDKLINAIKNDEFEIYYQPQVNVEEKIIGVEALARWFSDEHGMVLPDKFIPILEKNSMIYEFQNYILNKSCRQIKHINSITGKNIKLSINISPLQIDNDNFAKDMKSIITECGFLYENLEFEITETYPLNSIENLNGKLTEIRDMNIKISLDDFGKGYTSLEYLLDFNFDKVKIDKKYIDIITDKTSFVEHIIKMIHSVGCEVVSEGVEHKKQADILKKLECDAMQGYYFYKPLSFNELLKVI